MTTQFQLEPVQELNYPQNCKVLYFKKLEEELNEREFGGKLLPRPCCFFNNISAYESVKNFVVSEEPSSTLEEEFEAGRIGLFFYDTRETIFKEGETEGKVGQTEEPMKTILYLDDQNSNGRFRLVTDFNRTFGPAKEKGLSSNNIRTSKFLSWKNAPRLWTKNFGSDVQEIESWGVTEFLENTPEDFKPERDYVLIDFFIKERDFGGLPR